MIQITRLRSGTRKVDSDSHRRERQAFGNLIYIKTLDIVQSHHFTLHSRQTAVDDMCKTPQHIRRISRRHSVIISNPVTDILQTCTLGRSTPEIYCRTCHSARHVALGATILIIGRDRATTLPQTAERFLQGIIGIVLIAGDIQSRPTQAVPHADEYFRESVACHYY